MPRFLKIAGRRYSLKVTIASLFIGMILTLGISLGWYNYRKTSELLFETSNELFRLMGGELTQEFNGTTGSVSQAVNMLANSPVARSTSLEGRLQAVDMFIVALNQEPQLTGLQLGYADGDYFIVRPLDSDFMRRQFQAPEGSRYVVDNVEEDSSGRMLLTRLWLDTQGEVIKQSAEEETDYDPRGRPWFVDAVAGQKSITSPYWFFFTQKVGVTLSWREPGTGVVAAGDVTLSRLSDILVDYPVSVRSEVILLAPDGRVLASQKPEKNVRRLGDDDFELAGIEDFSGSLAAFGAHFQGEGRVHHFDHAGETWIAQALKLDLHRSESGVLVMVTPKKELFRKALDNQLEAGAISAAILLLAVLMSWSIARWIAEPLTSLSGLAGRIARFDFRATGTEGSFISEVDVLSEGMSRMQATISRFLSLISSLAGEQDFDVLMRRICEETTRAGEATGAFIQLVNEQDGLLHPGAFHAEGVQADAWEKLGPIGLDADHQLVAMMKAGQTGVVSVDGTTHDFSPLLDLLPDEAYTAVVLPLHNRRKEAIGILGLLYPADFASSGRRDDHLAFLEALSGFAAVTLESRHLLKMQKDLLDAFIKLMAGAIDAKSPYTGGHCQRVPLLTRLLAEEACASTSGPYADFTLDGEQWEALEIASWLHDCGKVTTPEYVVDKSTKLETLNDRIHEVRMRFEVLKRDARIAYWEKVTAGENQAEQAELLEVRLQELDDDFVFVAACNQGGEFLEPADVERLQAIAARTWQRTLDDRLGISWEEKQRKDTAGTAVLPVDENLLMDRPDHLVARDAKQSMAPDNPYGFKLDTPEYQNNLGELYNLSVSRGTLNAEERYLINDHIVQTIVMLNQLPYPAYLKDVPDIAGGHHEKVDGTGYPRGLAGDELSVPARMMAIADVFEALTASDRPYKKAKTLSEAVRIMGFMVEDSHLDGDLFRLFLGAGIHEKYGRENLLPEQVDEVDLAPYLA